MSLQNSINSELKMIIFDKLIPAVIDIIINEYDVELCSFIIDSRSKTRPDLYIELFRERLEEFEYVHEKENNVYFSIPDLETFDFSGKLAPIKNILEGVAGLYYEATLSILKKMRLLKKQSSSRRDLLFSDDNDLYIISYDYVTSLREKHELRDELVIYPFSNTPPLPDIFKKAEEYVSMTMPSLIDEAIKNVVGDKSSLKKELNLNEKS